MIKALIFDFDGLILDTETPALESWREIYAEHGHEISLEQWKEALGRGAGQGFDPLQHLADLVGPSLDIPTLSERRRLRKQQLCEGLPLMPGITELLDQADELGMPCAVASSSGRDWVELWLKQHTIYQRFRCVRTADDVAAAKPAPDLFLSAAAAMGVSPEECLVFEDSPNGILAARAAGMRCVAVPCTITAQLALPPTELVLTTLAGCRLPELLAQVESVAQA